MKKSTIKRRKRVVPALQEQISEKSNSQMIHSSVSPEASPSTTYAEQYPPMETSPGTSVDSPMNSDFRPGVPVSDYRHPYEPPPIDFTGYLMTRSPAAAGMLDKYQHRRQPTLEFPGHLHPPLSIPPIAGYPPPSQRPLTRKRRFSAADDFPNDTNSENARANRLGSISSILNPPQQHPRPAATNTPTNDPTLLDPNLTGNALAPLPPRGPSSIFSFGQPPISATTAEQSPRPASLDDAEGGDFSTTDGRATRKARLKHDADALRDMLRAKERELEELNGQG